MNARQTLRSAIEQAVEYGTRDHHLAQTIADHAMTILADDTADDPETVGAWLVEFEQLDGTWGVVSQYRSARMAGKAALWSAEHGRRARVTPLYRGEPTMVEPLPTEAAS